MHISSSLLGVATLALTLSSFVSAQDEAAPGTKVPVTYHNDESMVIATDEVAFNVCHPSEAAFSPYSFINFDPKNVTINFYKDSNCNTIAFGLDGYYGGYPGKARSLKWVGYSMDHRGELLVDGFTSSGTPSNPPQDSSNSGKSESPNIVAGDQNTQTPSTGPHGGAKEESSSSSTFFGGVVGSMVVLSIGGVIFWKTAGKKMAADKGKGVLPYNRVGGRGRDGDILLTSNGHRDQNSFELGDEYDEDDDDEDRSRRHRSGRGGRYHDDDDQV